MFRRVLLALLLATSMTLSGVASCGTTDPCKEGGEMCEPGECCDGYACRQTLLAKRCVDE